MTHRIEQHTEQELREPMGTPRPDQRQQPGASGTVATARTQPRDTVADTHADGESFTHRLRRWLAFRNISAIYVGIAIFVVVALWIPDTFLVWTTWKTVLDAQAIAGLAAVALVIPLAAGVFNLAIGTQVGVSSIMIGWLLIDKDVSLVPAIVATLAAGALIGLVTGLLIIKARIDSFIATLGVSSLLAALITGISDGQQILGMPDNLANLGSGEVGGLTYPVIALFLVSIVVWYVLERTPLGRHIYATGGNIEAARLAGVRTAAVIVGSLVACGVVAGIGGVLVTARLANADPTIGPAYLLPAFTAAFLGSTQFKGGRFNVWGTIVAVYVLAMGVKGLQLAGAPVWIPDAFNGAALLIAVAMARFQGDPGRVGGLKRLISRNRAAGT